MFAWSLTSDYDRMAACDSFNKLFSASPDKNRRNWHGVRRLWEKELRSRRQRAQNGNDSAAWWIRSDRLDGKMFAKMFVAFLEIARICVALNGGKILVFPLRTEVLLIRVMC